MISLIVPTRNRAQSLLRLLNSLKEQGYIDDPDIQVIIADNGGHDRSAEAVCMRFGVDCIRCSTPGRSSAINEALKIAQGDYVAFTDDDVIVTDRDWLCNLKCHFDIDASVGYVSGNVVAESLNLPAQKMWEAKGGLSKGLRTRVFDKSSFEKRRLEGFPVRLIAAGANSMIPKLVLEEVGLFDERFGPGSPIPHGESLDMCYRVLRAGYTAVYEPAARVYHSHPTSVSALRKKMFIYGIGDTAVHSKFFIEFHDIRSLFEVLWGRVGLLLQRLVMSIAGRYSLPPSVALFSVLGAFLGPLVYLFVRVQNWFSSATYLNLRNR